MQPRTEEELSELLEASGREGEALFSRGDDDILVRREKATREQFDEKVKITIDGIPLEVPRAVPARDFLGNIRVGPDGNPIPRSTTVYDAAAIVWKAQELDDHIPVLCHQEHVTPIAVCRLCSVQIARIKDGKRRSERKLVPACQHRVEDGMDVTTRRRMEGGKLTRDASRVESSVKLLTEILISDHRHPAGARDRRFRNELTDIATTSGVKESRFREGPTGQEGRNFKGSPTSRRIELTTIDKPPTNPTARTVLVDEDTKTLPYSSRTILVDHDNCILCDRCVRGCAEVKGFSIIGHTGKGYKTRISFDLDEPMNNSNCVQCGECATACPTGALIFRRRVAPTGWEKLPRVYDPDTKTNHSAIHKEFDKPLPEGILSARQMEELELVYTDSNGKKQTYRPFSEIPFAYLRWNEGAVLRRRVQPGDVLCRQGDYASTAFLLANGSFTIWKEPEANQSKGVFNWLRSRANAKGRVQLAKSDHNDLLLGELACLTGKRRAATIEVADDGEIYEVKRNLLDMMQRTAEGRKTLDAIYRARAVRDCLYSSLLFQLLSEEQKKALLMAFLSASAILRCDPGERIVSEGDPAGDFYILRLGFAEVTKRSEGKELPLNILGPGQHFGEIGLLWDHPIVRPEFPAEFQGRRRTASVTALDHAELLRVNGEAFRKFLVENSTICDNIARGAVAMLKMGRTAPSLTEQRQAEYVKLGLYQGQKLLVLDLERCTRCDECTRGCADSHGDGYSRLMREGLRFGNYLVATCCRSCHKPYCLDGCPVDAIHRKGAALEVVIDNHCIGCGLCARNCPYESIQMVTRSGDRGAVTTAADARRAVNCDLCHDLVPDGADPYCVASCPHEAAFRMSGEELKRVTAARKK